MAFVKNFDYGELWEGKAHPSLARRGREVVKPETLTQNTAFLDFLESVGYRVFLDYDYPQYAHTDMVRKEIVLNGNYSMSVLASLLKHELGHLMLFDVNQFTTVRPQTLRSAIAKEIYTPDNLVKYGLKQLLWGENVIQDVIIETVGNSDCVCHNLLTEVGGNAGVKHLTNLESPALIAREVIRTQLVERDEWAPTRRLNGAEELLDAMLEDLDKDLEEAERKLKGMAVSEEWKRNEKRKRNNQRAKATRDIEQLEKKVEKLKGKPGKEEAVRKLRDLIRRRKEEARELDRGITEAAEAARERAMKSLEKKINNAREVREALEGEREAVRESDASAGAESEGAGSGDDGTVTGGSAEGEVDGNVTPNLTDHLGGDGEEGGNTHTFDCGLPMRVSVSREESVQRERMLRRVDSRPRVRKIEIDEDVEGGVESRGRKSLEKESTYFRNSKREFDGSDMLRGKRKKFESGIGVMIGLDVSGSMSEEWGRMFEELSELIEGLRDSLDIEHVVYFTYDSHLREWSDKISDLELGAFGGNAFGYVYQELMQKAPVLQKNEIILVTDCGDNLGWKLDDSCEVRRRGVTVENHVSIIDTEGAGFYEKSGFDDSDWSLHHKGDPGLFDALQRNLEALISR